MLKWDSLIRHNLRTLIPLRNSKVQWLKRVVKRPEGWVSKISRLEEIHLPSKCLLLLLELRMILNRKEILTFNINFWRKSWRCIRSKIGHSMRLTIPITREDWQWTREFMGPGSTMYLWQLRTCTLSLLRRRGKYLR